MGLIRTILIIGAIYYALKLIGKYLFPYFLKRFINKQQQKYSSYSNSRNNANASPKESKPLKKEKKDNLGDYVEYEEVE